MPLFLRGARVAAAATLALGLAWGAAALTRVPVELHDDEAAAVRLSWRLDAAVVRDCRPATEEERQRMPAHMTRDEVCEERIVPYLLSLDLDQDAIVRQRVRARGARGDRPLSVFSEHRVPPGEHRVRVRFAPADADAGAGAGPADAAFEDDLAAGLPVLELDTVFRLDAREVALVTYDRDRERLVLRLPSPR